MHVQAPIDAREVFDPRGMVEPAQAVLSDRWAPDPGPRTPRHHRAPAAASKGAVAIAEQTETVYRAGNLTVLGAIRPRLGFTDKVIHLFLARDLAAGPSGWKSHAF